METKYTKEILEPIVKDCFTMSDVLRKLGLQTRGSSFSYIKRIINMFEIDTSHFKGRGWSERTSTPSKERMNEYLTNQTPIQSSRLKLLLFKANIFEEKCYTCGLTEWCGEKIPLELHHIDQNSTNNNINNLMIVCPNCHAKIHRDVITNKKNDKLNNTRKKYSSGRVWTIDSKIKTRKVERPPLDILIKELNESSFTQVAKKHGVTDNAIRKWIKHYKKYGKL